MTDLNSLKLKFCQDSDMVTIPDTMTRDMFLTMQKIMDRALDYSLQMTRFVSTAEALHADTIPADDLRTMQEKKARLQEEEAKRLEEEAKRLEEEERSVMEWESQ